MTLVLLTLFLTPSFADDVKSETKTATKTEAPAAASSGESSDYEVDYEEEPGADENADVQPEATPEPAKRGRRGMRGKKDDIQGSRAEKKFTPIMKSESKSIYRKNGKSLDVDPD